MEICNIPSFCVIVGANRTGNSSLFDVFSFLKDCLSFNLTTALRSRGGFREIVSRGHEHETIKLEIRFRTSIKKANRLFSYLIEISQDENNHPLIEREILRYERSIQGKPIHLLDFTRGKGFAISTEEDFDTSVEELRPEEQQVDPDSLAIKGIGQFQRFKVANALRQFIENWNVSDFQINLARGSKDASGYDEHLSKTGDNLQLAANYLYENHRAIFDAILLKMQQRVPGLGIITPETTNDGRLLLKFQDGSFKDPFIDKYVSDGTIKMFAFLVLLHDPTPHHLLCVEEPENQLYPALLSELAEEFRDYALRGGQVFVTTHSPDFLNAAELDEVFWLVKKAGYTQVHHARDDVQLSAYMKSGDRMGYLWKEGFFEGAVNLPMNAALLESKAIP